MRGGIQRAADPVELQHVEAALALFYAPDERRLAIQPFRQFALGEPGFPPQIHKLLQHELVLPAVHGFLHGRIMRPAAPRSQIAGE